MDKSNKLLKDIFLFAIASFGPKFISFFLVPLYTAQLSTHEYGVFELLNTVVSLILPIITLDISDAILVFTIEYRKEQQHSENTPFKYGCKVLCFSAFVLLIVCISVPFIFSRDHIVIWCIYIWVNVVTQSLYLNLLAYLRGTDHVPIIVFTSICNSIVTILSNVIFILFLHMGVYGLLIANWLGNIVCDIIICHKIKIFDILKEKTVISNNGKNSMLRLSIPLIFTGIAWWINSSADRLFLTLMVGVSANGIYAVAAKIPSILTAVHSVFYQAMQLSVFSEIDNDNRDEYLKKLYRLYTFMMIFVCSTLIIFNKLIAHVLFRGSFFVSYKYVPPLLIATVLFSITGYITTITTALRDTKIIAQATIVGACINILFNYILIKPLEIYGAVIATVLSYFVIWFIIMMGIRKVMNLNFGVIQSILLFLLLIIQWIISTYKDGNYFLQIVIFILILVMNSKAIKEYFLLAKRLLFRKRKNR